MNDLFLKIHDSLPIFLIEDNPFQIIYTPGYFLKIKAIPINELVSSLNNPEQIEYTILRNSIINILNKAEKAVDNWEIQKQIPFSPECLTIHVGSDCNLNCSYCYSKLEGTGNKNLTGFPQLWQIKQLFNYIVKNKTGSKNLTIVFHGSGEPTFHWQKLFNSYQAISELAKQHEIKIFTYIATNGYLEEDKIEWLAKNMNLIGISCDGPQAIQQKQRDSGNRQYLPIEKICRLILEKGGKFDIRVTITRKTISNLNEIVSYLIDDCNAKNIHVEPVYLAGENGFSEKDADEFFNRYWEAKKFARKCGVNIDYSGIRLTEFHGTYCDVLRNTLRLTTDGLTRNCFCFMNDDEEFITGQLDKEHLDFQLSPVINELKKKTMTIPNVCFECINIYHCSRGCPDFCFFENEHHTNKLINPFRCRLHQLLAVEEIKKLVVNGNK